MKHLKSYKLFEEHSPYYYNSSFTIEQINNIKQYLISLSDDDKIIASDSEDTELSQFGISLYYMNCDGESEYPERGEKLENNAIEICIYHDEETEKEIQSVINKLVNLSLNSFSLYKKLSGRMPG